MLKPFDDVSSIYEHTPYPLPISDLFRLFMRRMLLAELAILAELQAIWIVLLVFIGLIVAILAFRAGQSNCVTHRFLHPFHNVTNII